MSKSRREGIQWLGVNRRASSWVDTASLGHRQSEYRSPISNTARSRSELVQGCNVFIKNTCKAGIMKCCDLVSVISSHNRVTLIILHRPIKRWLTQATPAVSLCHALHPSTSWCTLLVIPSCLALCCLLHHSSHYVGQRTTASDLPLMLQESLV